jgi:hypothetical protein
MRAKTWYLILCLAGALVPCARFVPLLGQYGLESRLLLEQLSATATGGFVGTEAIVSVAALWVFIGIEGRRSQTRRLWIPVAASLLVGVSLGLPVFLYMREARIQGSMFAGGRCEV